MTCVAPPHVPQALNGVIGLRASECLRVEALPWAGMAEGEQLLLFCNDAYVGQRRVGHHDLGQLCGLSVPGHFLQARQARLHWAHLRVGQPLCESPRCTLKIKLTVPGGGPAYTSGEENPALPPLQLAGGHDALRLEADQLEQGVRLRIPRYAHRDLHDCITVRWGDVRFDLPPIDAKQLGRRRLKARVPREVLLEAGNDPHLEASYCVIDQAGNVSGWAPPRVIAVSLAPGAL